MTSLLKLVKVDLRECRDKKLRNKLVKEIKVKGSASIRDIAGITGLSKDIIFRA